MRGQDFFAGDVEGEPLGAVDFRDFEGLAGARRPFDGRGVADERGGVEVALKGPGADDFAAELLDVSQRLVAAIGCGGRGEAGFFAEFAAGGVEDVFAGDDGSFGDGPGTEVAAGPEGSAGMGEQDLEACGRGGAAVQDESGAVLMGPRMDASRFQKANASSGSFIDRIAR